MIPVVPEDVLRRNPQFSDLHQDLIKNKLNADATIKDEAKWKRRREVEEKLHVLRKELTKQKLLESYLRNLSSRESALPQELLEVVDVAVSVLYPRAEEPNKLSQNLRQNDIEKFKESAPVIARAVSAHIEQDIGIIADISVSDETVRSQEERVELLPECVDTLLRNTEDQRNDLIQNRKRTISTLDNILILYEEVIEKLIRIIEQTKCGLVARAAKAQAKHLALVSEGFEGKLRVLYFEAMDQVYNPEMLSALENYHLHLKDTKVRLLQRQKIAESDLKKYDNAGKEMKELVTNYTDIIKQIEAVKVDIKRLGGDV